MAPMAPTSPNNLKFVRPTSSLERKLVELEQRVDALENAGANADEMNEVEPRKTDRTAILKARQRGKNCTYTPEGEPTKTMELTEEELEWLENVVMTAEIEYDSINEERIIEPLITRMRVEHKICLSILSKLHKLQEKE